MAVARHLTALEWAEGCAGNVREPAKMLVDWPYKKRANRSGFSLRGGNFMDPSRRNAILGTAAVAAAPLLTSTQIRAEAPAADKQAPSFYRYKVGDIRTHSSPTRKSTTSTPRSRRPSCRAIW
jgi:hypothetical protein